MRPSMTISPALSPHNEPAGDDAKTGMLLAAPRCDTISGLMSLTSSTAGLSYKLNMEGDA